MDTPYRDILYTNSVPLDDECQRIRDLLVAPMQEVADITPEIIRVQAHLDQLTRRRDHLTEFIDSHLALVSPARKLPHDILREIFKLSQVCRDWRILTLAMPDLWNSLQVVVDTTLPDPDTRIKKMNDGLKAWLPRSRSLPLTISVMVDEFGHGDPSILLQTLVEVSRRWLNIRFLLPSYSSLHPLGTLSPDDVPMLKTISIDSGIQMGSFQNGPPPHATFMSFASAPNIHNVSIRRPTNSFRYPLNWEELRNLSIGDEGLRTRQNASSFITALPLLSRCSKLETLTMPIYDFADITLPAPLRLARLRRLCIVDCTKNGTTTSGTTNFFGHTVLPNLRHLEYAAFKHRPIPLTFLRTLRAPEELTSLSLSVSLSTDFLADGLRLLPMLQDLIIHRPTGDSQGCQLFSLLTQGPNNILCRISGTYAPSPSTPARTKRSWK
ncbi:hypothetical protein DFH09DRAFT_1381452 [Mycena vulgaris]|nr:hypothetical protein DFH09DRAFT_1381452 [Mycena vulgaris]